MFLPHGSPNICIEYIGTLDGFFRIVGNQDRAVGVSLGLGDQIGGGVAVALGSDPDIQR